MFNLTICEDDPELLDLYTIIVKKYMNKSRMTSLRLTLATTNPNEVEQQIKRNIDANSIYLLDIEFANSQIRGIDLATQIRLNDFDAKIIFITTHEELAPLSMQRKLNPFDFIHKEIGLEAIEYVLTTDLDQILTCSNISTETPEFIYHLGVRNYRISFSKIDYFETSVTTHKLLLHSLTEITEFRDTLVNIFNNYPFLVRSNKHFLINPYNIAALDNNNKLTFKDGLSLNNPFSKREIKLIKRLLNSRQEKHLKK